MTPNKRFTRPIGISAVPLFSGVLAVFAAAAAATQPGHSGGGTPGTGHHGYGAPAWTESAIDLQLTDEQLAQGGAILGELEADAEVLHTDANEAVRKILTAAQYATVELVNRPLALTADGVEAGHPPVGNGGAFGDSKRTVNIGFLLRGEWVGALGLSDEQQTGVAAAAEEWEGKWQARRDEGENALIAILTDEQRTVLDASVPGPSRRLHGPGHHAGLGFYNELGLSAEQLEQAKAIFNEAHTDAQSLISAAREEVRSALTDSQLAVLDDLQTETPQGWHYHDRRRLDLPTGLFESLTLTAQQAAVVDGIAQELEASLMSRADQASGSFRALLAAEQLAILDENRVVKLLLSPNLR